MQYEPLSRHMARRFLPHHDDIFRPAAHDTPILEWHPAGDGELLLCDGRPVARLACSARRWAWTVAGADAPMLRAGSRAEARQLAVFYARRTLGA